MEVQVKNSAKLTVGVASSSVVILFNLIFRKFVSFCFLQVRNSANIHGKQTRVDPQKPFIRK